jgi:hypothetical protein
MLPVERVIGKAEAPMSDATGIGVALELRCPHCGGCLKLIPEDQPWLHLSHLRCKPGHLLVVTNLNENGRSVLYLATKREPETRI